MNMCKKCGTFMALPGSEYCAGCNPTGINVNQGQLGTGAQQQAQNVNAFGISVSQQQSQVSGGSQQQAFTAGTQAESKTDKKVMKKLSKIDKRLKDVQDDVELIKEYTSQIELIFDKLGTLDDIEAFLKKKLSSDFEKIKFAWDDYKTGKIGKGALIKQGIKIIGKKFIKSFVKV